MVHCVTRSTIQHRPMRDILAIMYENRPKLHEEEKTQVRELLQREDERKQMIRQTLQEAINRMEGHRCIRGRHDPFMMRLVQVFVNGRMVQPAMDEVDAEVGEDEEERELAPVVPGAWAVREGIVELGVAADLGEEQGHGEEGDERHCVDGLADFHADLVFEEFGVFEGCLVEDEDVGEGGDDEVDCCASDPRGEVRLWQVNMDHIRTHQVMKYREISCRFMLSLVH